MVDISRPKPKKQRKPPLTKEEQEKRFRAELHEIAKRTPAFNMRFDGDALQRLYVICAACTSGFQAVGQAVGMEEKTLALAELIRDTIAQHIRDHVPEQRWF